MTGMQLLNITMRSGAGVKIDGGTADVLWDQVDWSGAILKPFIDTRVRATRASVD